MKLNRALEGKKVKIVDISGEIFEGMISDYIFPEDNEPEGIAAVVMHSCKQKPGEWIGFNENEIESIEVVV